MQADRFFNDNFYHFHSKNRGEKVSKTDNKLMQNGRFSATNFIVFTVFQSERNLKELTFSGSKIQEISPLFSFQHSERRWWGYWLKFTQI
jgi:hypothetical protein